MDAIGGVERRAGGYHPLAMAGVALLGAVACLFVATTGGGLLALYGLVAALFAVCFTPAWYARGRGQIDYFEVVHVRGFIYFMQFGVGSIAVFHNPQMAFSLHTVPYLPQAAAVALVGYVALLAGYYGPWLRRASAASHRLNAVPRGSMLLIIPGAVGLVSNLMWGEAIRFERLGLPSVTGLTSLFGQLSPLFLFAWALGWLLYFSKSATRSQRMAFYWLLVPGAALGIWVHVSDKSESFTLLLTPLIAFWYSRRRLPWIAIIALLLVLVFVLFPIYNTYRNWDYAVARDERMAMTLDTVSRWDRSTYLERSAIDFIERMALVTALAVVVREVPRWEPFLGPADFVMAPFLLLIPRIVWPDKPESTIGREFGQRFHLVNYQDDYTSIAPSLPGEFYWYFGLIGVVVGMTLFGVGFRWLYRRYASAGVSSPVDLATYMMILPSLLTIDGGIVSSMVGITKLLILMAVLRAVCRRFGGLVKERPAIAAL